MQVHKLYNDPSNTLGNDGDIAVYNRNFYFKNNGEWVRLANDILKQNTTKKDEIAIWQGNLRLKSIRDLTYNETSGLGLNSSNITTTGNGSFGEITSGAVVWEKFDFAAASTTSGSYHFKDVDDTTNNAGLWDATDTDPTSFSYLNVPGQYSVPENCTLKAMYVTCSNFSSSDDITIAIYHGTPNFDTTSDTTLALAGTATTVTIGTMRRAYGANATYSVNLDAGDIVVPTFKQDSGSTKAIRGSITLKFVTR